MERLGLCELRASCARAPSRPGCPSNQAVDSALKSLRIACGVWPYNRLPVRAGVNRPRAVQLVSKPRESPRTWPRNTTL